MKLNILIFSIICALIIFIWACRKPNVIYSPDKEGFYDVIIVGGGFSGLTAAYYLKDKKILLLEKESQLGGRCMNGIWESFHYPKGTEYIGPPEPYMQSFFNQIRVNTKQVPPPTDGVAYNGNLFLGNNLLDYLGTPSTISRYYQLMDELNQIDESGIEYAVWEDQELLSNYSVYDEQTVEEWLNANGYDKIIREFVDVENRGLFGSANKDLSFLFNINEMAYDLPDTTSINESECYTFDNGMYTIVEGIESIIKDKIIKSAEVIQVTVNNDLTVIVKYIKNGVTKTVRAKTVVMATPATITEKLLVNGISEQVRKTLANTEYTQYATINLFLSERVLNQTWSISCVEENSVATLYDAIRTQVSDSYTGKSILGVYLAPLEASDKNFIYRSDNEILQNAYTTLEKYFPDIQSKVLGFDITRFKYAFPVFNKNYYNDKIKCFINDHSVQGPVFLAGDYLIYATYDGAYDSGVNAAESVNDYLKGE